MGWRAKHFYGYIRIGDKVFQMNAKKRRPFQPLEDGQIRYPRVPYFGGEDVSGVFPWPRGIFVGCTVNAFMFGIGIFCGEGPGTGLTFLVPREGGPGSRDFPD